MSDPKNPDRGSQRPPGPGGKGGKQQPGDVHVTVPSAPAGKGSKEEAYLKWAKAHGINRKTAADIWFWSTKYGTTVGGVEPFAYYWSAVLLRESGAKHSGLNSSGHGYGIGQINPSVWVGATIPWRKDGKKFTNDNNPETGIQSYGVNLRFSAWYTATNVQQYGYDNAYAGPPGSKAGGYNHGATQAAADIQSILKTAPKGVNFAPSSGPGPTTPNPGDNSSPIFKDPYVTGINKKGKFTTTNDPNRAIQYDGRPLTRSDFLSLRDQLTSMYVSYTGKRPTNAQVQQYIVKGWNAYTLESLLSHSKSFQHSPIWKEFVANWKNDPTIKNLIPKGGAIPPELARMAIVNHWNGDTVANMLRKQKGYLQSNDFAGRVANFINLHSTIMGTPDQNAMIAIKDAVLQGWDENQYAAWLRAQPTYTSSTEYKSKALGFLSSIGFLLGTNPVLAKGVGPGPGERGRSTQQNPADPRVKGDPTNLNPSLPGLGVTLSNA